METPTKTRTNASECAVGEAFMRFGPLPAGTRERYFCLTPAGYFAPYEERTFVAQGDELDGDGPSNVMIRVA